MDISMDGVADANGLVGEVIGRYNSNSSILLSGLQPVTLTFDYIQHLAFSEAEFSRILWVSLI
jgi:hypothetical protein